MLVERKLKWKKKMRAVDEEGGLLPAPTGKGEQVARMMAVGCVAQCG